MSTLPGTSPAPQTFRNADPVHRRLLTATAIAVVLIGSLATAVTSAPASPHPALPAHTPAGSAGRSSRPDRADWEKIKAAAHLRDLGLAAHRTAHFRSFAGFLGLSQLATIQPLAPGRCQVALRYLYGNLLDLRDAHPGEHWAPLRRFVAKEPSIRACAPRRRRDAPSVADHQASADGAALKTVATR